MPFIAKINIQKALTITCVDMKIKIPVFHGVSEGYARPSAWPHVDCLRMFDGHDATGFTRVEREAHAGALDAPCTLPRGMSRENG